MPERHIIAIQIYDGRVVAEWTLLEWIGELEIMKIQREAMTPRLLQILGIHSTDNFKGESLLDV